jgi:hypothetical protein
MEKMIVCKTVVPYPERPRFISFYEHDEGVTVTVHQGLENLANNLQTAVASWHGMRNMCCVKNDVPGNIIWATGDTPGCTPFIVECERLSSHEMSELAKLLKK